MLENVSDKKLKRIRLRFIRGIDYSGEFISEESFDLFDEDDFKRLMLVINTIESNSDIGFVVEGSSFEQDTYDNSKLGENEFISLKEIYIGEIVGKNIKIANDLFTKVDFIETVTDFDELMNKLKNIVYEIKKINNISDTAKIFNYNQKHEGKVYMYN